MDLHDIAHRLVAEEEKRGHDKVADDLRRILKSVRQAKSLDASDVSPGQGLVTLPVNKRTGARLAEIRHFDSLSSSMVLSKSIESRFSRIEKEFTSREKLAMHGFRPKRKILLYGPPGCGKTLGAERLAANLRIPLIKVRFDAIVSSYLGETASNLRSAFDLACGGDPKVLLLDECDFIAKSRVDPRDVGEMSRVVNVLLHLLDEYSSPGLLVATTNLHGSLDPAIYRRFDESIEIPLPGKKEREQLLRRAFQGMEVGKKFCWQRYIEALDGRSAADIVRIGEEAAKITILQHETHILDRHVKEALELAGVV